jgi:CheY-like chemotaxis protein
LSRRIRHRGYRTLEAERAEAALELLQHEKVDLLLSDIVMPGGPHGVELAHTVRQRWPTIRIVLTSGFPEPRSRVGREFPSDFQLLSKPYTSEDLARVLHDSLEGERPLETR